jgi:hypothetical protein
LAQFKRRYNYPFSVTNKKTPGAKFFRRGHRIQGIRSIRFDCPSLDVPKLSGGKPALTGAFDVQSRNASKLDQKSVSARRPPGSAERQHPIINPPRNVVRVRPAPTTQPVMHKQIVEADR